MPRARLKLEQVDTVLKNNTTEMVAENPDNFPVKYCDVCKSAWEYDKTSSGSRLRTVYHTSFPKLGLQHQKCFNCTLSDV